MKVLFVGDLRPAKNYGAIATTSALLDLFQKESSVSELELIDHRSFVRETPENGFPPAAAGQRDLPPRFMKLRILLNRMGLYDWALDCLKKSSKKKADPLPCRFDQYEKAGEKVQAGEFFAYESEMIRRADVVVINSEGNIVNGTDKQGRYRRGGRYVLFFAWVVKTIFKKPCYIINHTVDPKNRDIKRIIQQVYPLCDGIYVREKLSCRMLDSYGVSNYRYVPDALWSHDYDHDPEVHAPDCLKDFDFSQPFLCIGDSSGIHSDYATVSWDVEAVYSELIDSLRTVCPNLIFIDGFRGDNPGIRAVTAQKGIPSVNLRNCSCGELYYVLSHAKLFISGRWHASIMALMGHTPILLWGSDSHKTEALYSEVNYPYEFFDVKALPLNIDRITDEARKILTADHQAVWDQVDQLRTEARHNTDMLRNE